MNRLLSGKNAVIYSGGGAVGGAVANAAVLMASDHANAITGAIANVTDLWRDCGLKLDFILQKD
jgi:hypothetical protein